MAIGTTAGVGRIAQLVECLLRMQIVQGSIPCVSKLFLLQSRLVMDREPPFALRKTPTCPLYRMSGMRIFYIFLVSCLGGVLAGATASNLAQDYRPIFHPMPEADFTNDIDGPFFWNGMYHLLFAHHVNQTCFCNVDGGYNRWAHLVSKDLARWERLEAALLANKSTNDPSIPCKATPYDGVAVMTGSTTVLSDGPLILYSSNPVNGINYARPANLSDPLLRYWIKDPSNPIFSNQGAGLAPMMRDPSTAWYHAGSKRWMLVLAGQPSAKGSMEPELWSTDYPPTADIERSGPGTSSGWKYEGIYWRAAGGAQLPPYKPMLECPDTWPVLPQDRLEAPYKASSSSSSTPRTKTPLWAFRWSGSTGAEPVVLGQYDPSTGHFVPLPAPTNGSAPRTPYPPLHLLQQQSTQVGVAANADNDTYWPQRLGQGTTGGVYASKSMRDPVHQQQVWWGWIHEGWMQGSHCVNRSVCGTHTVPRALVYDPATDRLKAYPVPQLDLLRLEQLVGQDDLPIHAGVVADWTKQVAGGPSSARGGLELDVEVVLRPSSGAIGAVGGTAFGAVNFTLRVRATVGPDGRVASDPAQFTDVTVQFVPSTRNEAAASGVAGWVTMRMTVTAPPTASIESVGRKWSTQAIAAPAAVMVEDLAPGGSGIALRVLVDHSVVEAFVMGGRAQLVGRTYPADEAVGVALLGGEGEGEGGERGGGGTMVKGVAWAMGGMMLPAGSLQ